MRLWSLLLASACSLSHSCLSFSPGKATPRRRVKPEDCVSLDKVTDDSWEGGSEGGMERQGKKKNERLSGGKRGREREGHPEEEG